MSFITDTLREQLDCRQIAEHYKVRFRNRASSWWLGHCFNATSHARGDRNPSLSMSAQGYKCFSANCAISGDVFSLIAHFEGLDMRADFERVLKIAAELSGSPLDALRQEHGYQWRASLGRSKNYSPTQARQAAARAAHTTRERDVARLLKHTAQDAPLRTAQATQEQLAEQRQLVYDLMRRSLNPNQPPPFESLFPSLHDELFTLDPRHPRLDLMRHIWSLIQPLALTRAASTWLKSRGLGPELAHAYGCRDWTPVSEQILGALSEYPPQALEASGLRRTQEGRVKEWIGLRALRGESWAQGLAIPIIHPAWPLAPIAWRWRLYHPVTSPDGKTYKAMAQYGGSPPFPSLPLGATPPTAEALAGLARWPTITTDPENPRYALIISEGEPDWLSVAEVTAQLELPLYPVSLGLVAMSHGFPHSLIGLLEGAERIICVMDRGNTNKKWAKPGGEVVIDKLRAMLYQAGMERGERFEACYERVSHQVLPALQPDDQDINDLHQRSALRPLLERLLGGLR